MPRPRTGSCRWRDGAWRIQTYAGRDDTTGRGRYVARTVRAPNTKAGEKVARKALAQLLLEVQAGVLTPTTRERHTFAELIDQWIEHRAQDWPAGTDTKTRAALERHVLPTLGRQRLDAIRPGDIDALYGRLRKQGLSPGTVAKLHSHIHAALQQAIRWQYLTTNPATLATKPTIKKANHRTLPDPELLRRVIHETKTPGPGRRAQPWLAMALRLSVHTGARRSEIARLRWRDVDDQPGRTIVTFHQTKTDSFKRVILGAATAAELHDWHQTVREQAMAVGRPDLADLWVFPSWRQRLGDHIRPDQLTQNWDSLRSRYRGLDGVRLHDLRHTMATELIGDGHDVRTVANRGGWSSPSVLLGTYAHAVDASEVAAAQAMDDWLDGPSTSPSTNTG